MNKLVRSHTTFCQSTTMLLYALLVSCVGSVLAQNCPHLQTGLRRWSDATQWTGGEIPGEGADVVISDAVLLDQTTARLNTITIESSGQLVWSPEGDFTLTVSYVAVHGRFDIGSETCTFDAKANIKLTGDIDSAPTIPGKTDQKVIAVLPGGTLEIHGKRKLSWTKLVKTVPKAQGLISGFEGTCQAGIYVFELDAATGELINSKRHTTKHKSNVWVATGFEKHLDEIADGTMVLIAACKTVFGDFIDRVPVYDSIERLLFGSVTGTSLIRQITPFSLESYAAYAIKGSPSLSEEIYQPEGSSSEGQHSIITRTFWDLKFKVTVESFVTLPLYESYIDARARTVDEAYPVLQLLDDASTWLPGDRIFMASTDFDHEQAEEATVITCTTCSPTQVKIDLEPKYSHWGEMEEGVDERGEVGLLTRYIRIEGETEDSCPTANGNCDEFPYDTFGGHVKVIGPGFQNVHIEGAELYHMGQQTKLGRYPIHFHMCLDVEKPEDYPNPPYVKDTSIHHTFSRCITIHGTSGVSLIDNVGFDALGHCFFLEDGGERRNVLDGNLGASVKKGSLLPTDGNTVSVFWITNPKNTLRNNVAAGSYGHGIWYVFPTEPFGPSKGKEMMKPLEARQTKITEFTNNVVHSCRKRGLQFDNELLEDGTFAEKNQYDPREEPLVEDSPPVEAHLHRLTGYKNRDRNGWVRGGLWAVTESSFADSLDGFVFVGGDNQVQFLNTSILLGETRNIGKPSYVAKVQYDRALPVEYEPDHPIFGYRQAYGPVIIKDCWFNHFITTALRPAGAYGFDNKLLHATTAIQPTLNLQFGFDDGPTTGNRVYEGIIGETEYFAAEEGDFSPNIRDIDGTLTGGAYSTVVRSTPFHLTNKCYSRDNWQLSACPYRYGKLMLRTDTSWDNTSEWDDLQPFVMRDDLPTVKDFHDADTFRKGWCMIIGQEYSYTLNWEKKIHPSFRLTGHGTESDYGVRVGICLPLDAQIDLRRFGAAELDDLSQWEAASSVEEVDADTTGKKYYWDKDIGMLFVKFHNIGPTDPYYIRCPNQRCDNIYVTIESGTLTDADCSNRAYGPYIKTNIQDTVPVLEPNDLGMTSSTPPDGYGARETRPFLTREPVDGGFGDWGDWEECSVTCGGGVQVKRRMCDNPIPEHGGQNCDESLEARYQTQPCNTQAC